MASRSRLATGGAAGRVLLALLVLVLTRAFMCCLRCTTAQRDAVCARGRVRSVVVRLGEQLERRERLERRVGRRCPALARRRRRQVPRNTAKARRRQVDDCIAHRPGTPLRASARPPAPTLARPSLRSRFLSLAFLRILSVPINRCAPQPTSVGCGCSLRCAFCEGRCWRVGFAALVCRAARRRGDPHTQAHTLCATIATDNNNRLPTTKR